MNMDEIYAELDSLYGVDQGARIEPFITGKIAEAIELGDNNAIVQLLNELIGYYRESGEYEKCVTYCVRLINLVENSELKGSMAEATTKLNVANCFRASGLLKESNEMYQQVKAYYDACLPAESMLFASLFNNMSLLFQEMGDFESACDCLERALGITLLYDECYIEQATTYANLATTLIKLDRVDEATDCLTKSIAIFERDEDPDYHYSAALSALAEIMYVSKRYKESVAYYEKALAHIEKKLGRSRAYELTLQNLNAAKNCLEGTKGLQISKAYYEEFGIPMIREQFPEYESRIAAGLVGEGSECLGYDDKISRDHDFGPGFCIWLTDEDYDAIGESLQHAYDMLPKEYNGIEKINSGKASRRTGVFRISDFYKNILGIEGAPTSTNDWLFINDEQFLTATNGEVFTDPVGEFVKIRDAILEYYPRQVWCSKIARCAALMSQYGQYNYLRSLKRGDIVSATVELGKFIEAGMSMIYLLNREYAPFYKWMYKGLENNGEYRDVIELLHSMAETGVADERVSVMIEKICDFILNKLVVKGLAKPGDNYLDNHVMEIVESGRMNA